MADPVQIAIIEDDPAVLDSLRIYFERQAVKTSCFDAAKDFLAAVDRSAQFDCVVSDVRMPGVSGLDLVRLLKTRGFTPPIILITGHGDIDMAVSAIKIGAFDFIEKPFDETRLLASIRTRWSRNVSMTSDAAELEQVASPIQFALFPPASGHGACCRRVIEQGNRNAAENKRENCR